MISNEQLRRTFLSPAMKFYFDRKLAPLNSSEVDVRIEELLKYLNMAIHDRGDIPFSTDIDEVWHLWILETQEYQALCKRLQGAHFIHPTWTNFVLPEQPDAKEADFVLMGGLAVLSSYLLNYGPFQADRVRYWPLVEQLMACLGCDLDGLNDWLKSVNGQHSSAQAPALALM